MITFLHGTLTEALPTHATVDVHGVGYEVLIPASSFDKLPAPGSEVRLWTHLVIRDDAHLLFGFASLQEREIFRLLINTVSGIGPKTALNILSGISVPAFKSAVATGDLRALSSISGVGKKTSERILVELKDKLSLGETSGAVGLPRTGAPGEQTASDALLALLSLGYKQNDAQEMVRAAVAALGKGASVDQLVRASLKRAG